MTNQVNIERTERSRKYKEVFSFVFCWWFIYDVIGFIIFLYAPTLFTPLLCNDCAPRDYLKQGILEFVSITMSAGLVGAIIGIFLGGVQGVVTGFWIYYPVENVVAFRRQVILSNIALPTGLMVFITIFLNLGMRNLSDVLPVLYVAIVAYIIVIVIGLLVSRKFLRWWLQDTATHNQPSDN